MRAIFYLYFAIAQASMTPAACTRTHCAQHAGHRNDQGTLACLGAAR